MPKRAVDIHWHGSRIGSCHTINWYGVELHSATVSDETPISAVAALPIAFDPDFADLRGITGVELE
jgi:hypothetical protein